MKEELEKAIKDNARKAAATENSDHAMKYSQAALNAANAWAVITNIK